MILESKEYFSPQRRVRAFIVAYLKADDVNPSAICTTIACVPPLIKKFKNPAASDMKEFVFGDCQYVLRPNSLSTSDVLFGLVEADYQNFHTRPLRVALDLLVDVRHDCLGNGVPDLLHMRMPAAEPFRNRARSHV